MRFNELPISDGTKDAVAAMGYEEATPIQREAIPHLLRGRDVIGQARTGTGKTAAFGIPLVEELRRTRGVGVLGLVLVPTRELALQVHDALRDLARGSPLQVATAYGGTGFGAQTQALRSRAPTVLVACPGRLLDLMGRGIADLDGVRFLVLDEADRMLDMGFVHDVRRILRELPRDRQTSLFSATLDARVRRLSEEFLNGPVTVRAEEGEAATPLVRQFRLRVEAPAKTDVLLDLLHREHPAKAMVFTRTKHQAKRMARRLAGHGWSSVALQGNMTQNQREKAMAAFRDGSARVLVATDVASRGLDVPDVTHVVNYDLPVEPEAYVHRIGRTGRNGREGRSFTFVQADQAGPLRIIEQIAGSPMEAFPLERTGDAPRGPDPMPPQAQDAPRAAGPRPSGPAGHRGGGPRRRRSQGSGHAHAATAHPAPRRHGAGGGRRRNGPGRRHY